MSVNSVSSIVANAGNQYIQKTSANSTSSGQSTALQEAQETRAATQQEAAHGDTQAIRKLALEQQAQSANAAPKASTGTTVDLKA
jgi:hypothetical protein